jgi:hypothetical protein
MRPDFQTAVSARLKNMYDAIAKYLFAAIAALAFG